MEMRDLRAAVGVDLETAAEQIGIGKASLSRVERRLQIPSYAIILKISDWAEGQRQLRKLPSRYRLDWSWIQELQRRRDRLRGRRARAAGAA